MRPPALDVVLLESMLDLDGCEVQSLSRIISTCSIRVGMIPTLFSMRWLPKVESSGSRDGRKSGNGSRSDASRGDIEGDLRVSPRLAFGSIRFVVSA